MLTKELPKLVCYGAEAYRKNGSVEYDFAECPNCDHTFDIADNNWDKADYCPHCGQRIVWSQKELELAKKYSY